MNERQNIEDLVNSLFEDNLVTLAVLSAPREKGLVSKITIRPLLVKGQLSYQVTENYPQQARHRNLSKEDCSSWLKQQLGHFKQNFFYTLSADYHLLVGKKGNLTLLKKPPSKASAALEHNKPKDYLWQESLPIPFLVHLGVMSAEGKVYAAKRDKFRQINRFLEMIDDVLPHLGPFGPLSPLHLIDFGCGKAYLTFALYHFLKITKGYPVKITGIDLKKEVIQLCQELADTLGYQDDLQFVHGDINTFHTKEPVDLMVSLHACDTATDAALEKAIHWQAKVILCVPCCQHELMRQVQNDALRPLLKHGILKERFAALATDAARAQLLEVLGYQTQLLEFIDLEHTPKNLLIRAIKKSRGIPQHTQSAWQTYVTFKEALEISPSLERRFEQEINKILSDS
jgi:SAM-dependent methyltransferase